MTAADDHATAPSSTAIVATSSEARRPMAGYRDEAGHQSTDHRPGIHRVEDARSSCGYRVADCRRARATAETRYRDRARSDKSAERDRQMWRGCRRAPATSRGIGSISSSGRRRGRLTHLRPHRSQHPRERNLLCTDALGERTRRRSQAQDPVMNDVAWRRRRRSTGRRSSPAPTHDLVRERREPR